MTIKFLQQIFLFFFILNGYAQNQLDVFPALPNGEYESNQYAVEVTQNGNVQDSYVYMNENDFPSNLNARPSMTDFNHWTSFSFSGTVEVTITVLNASTVNMSQIRPLSKNINSTITGNKVTFTLTEASNLYLEVDGKEEDPIFIFANPLEVNRPVITDQNVIALDPGTHNIAQLVNGNFASKIFFFKPGIHNISKTLELQQGTTVYLAGGAYVKGLLKSATNADNITVSGRGILSGIEYSWSGGNWTDHMIEIDGSIQTNLKIEGVTLTNSVKTGLLSRGTAVVDNVKMLLFQKNSDGVTVGENSIVKNSFFKVNDDVIKLYYNNIKAYNNVIWHQPVGAIFQMSWKLSRNASNHEIYDIDVIHFDRNSGNISQLLNQSFLSCRNINGGHLNTIDIHDIRLEHQPYQLLGLMFSDNNNGAFMDGLGSIDNISFRNIEMENWPKNKSHIVTNGTQTGMVSNIDFCNINVSGNTVSSINDIIDFSIPGYNASFTSNINLTSGCQTLSTENFNASFNFNVYPNPTNGNITLQYLGNKNIETEIKVVDILGKQVSKQLFYSENASTVDLSLLENGVYFISILDVNSGSKILKRVVKN